MHIFLKCMGYVVCMVYVLVCVCTYMCICRDRRLQLLSSFIWNKTSLSTWSFIDFVMFVDLELQSSTCLCLSHCWDYRSVSSQLRVTLHQLCCLPSPCSPRVFLKLLRVSFLCITMTHMLQDYGFLGLHDSFWCLKTAGMPFDTE